MFHKVSGQNSFKNSDGELVMILRSMFTSLMANEAEYLLTTNLNSN